MRKKRLIYFIGLLIILLLIVLNMSTIKKLGLRLISFFNYTIRIDKNVLESNRKTYLLTIKENELKDFIYDDHVKINEVYCGGENNNWIELYNPSNSYYDLDGNYLLINSVESIKKYPFSKRTISPREYFTINFSSKFETKYYTDLYSSIKVSKGDTVYFYNKHCILIDSVIIPLDFENKKSWARIPDGKQFQSSKMTKNKLNNKAGIVLMFDDKRIDNHFQYRDLFKKYDARLTFTININYKCQFYSENNPYGLITNFGDSLSDLQIYKLSQLILDGHEIGNHHFNHIKADEYVKEYGAEKYYQDQILSIDSIFKLKNLPLIKSFVYSNHKRNKLTDSIISLRYYNYRGVSDENVRFSWKNERLLSGFRLDHHAEDPAFMYDIIFYKMPNLISSENVMIMWGHGITNGYDLLKYYTSDRSLSLIIKRARELGLKLYTMSELYTSTKPLSISIKNKNYLEIQNISDSPIDLQGFYINKNRIKECSYQIKNSLILQPKQKIFVYFNTKSNTKSNSNLYTSYTISNHDRIYLFWPDNFTVLDRGIIGDENFVLDLPKEMKKNTIKTIRIFDCKNNVVNNEDFEWFSENRDIVSVNQLGIIEAQKIGKVEIAIKSKFSGYIYFAEIIVK